MNKQSEASKRWQENAGLTIKAFKIKKSVADAFIEACNKRGVTQASVITEFMIDFINKTK